MVALTKHSKERIEQRIGLSRKYAPDHIEHVLHCGFPPEMFKGGSSFKKFLNKKQERHPDRKMLVYGHYIYVFSPMDVMITTIPVPKRYQDFLRNTF